MEFNVAQFKENTKDLKLLYVEHDADIREQIRQLLLRFFSSITVTGNGQEAYESFLEHKHDIIITDIILPQLNGIEFIRKVKAKGYSPIIIFLSSTSDIEYLTALIHLHIDYFALKPFNNKEFLLRLYILVSQRLEASLSQEETVIDAYKSDVFTIYNTIEEGMIVIEGNSIVHANNAFLQLSGHKDFATLKTEMPHIGTLFVVTPRSLDALDNQTFIQQLQTSDPAESTVLIARGGQYDEYMISCVELEEMGQYILTFTNISFIIKKYKKDFITGLPNKFALQEKLRILNMETPIFNVIVMSIKHFDVFINYYGKRVGNDLERFFIERIHKTLEHYSDNDDYFFAQFEQNKYVIISTKELGSLLRSLVRVHLNEFVISAKENTPLDKKEIDIDPMFKSCIYESEKDVEVIEVNLTNDFDVLNYYK